MTAQEHCNVLYVIETHLQTVDTEELRIFEAVGHMNSYEQFEWQQVVPQGARRGSRTLLVGPFPLVVLGFKIRKSKDGYSK